MEMSSRNGVIGASAAGEEDSTTISVMTQIEQ
jgi:hypothetical protein